MRGTYNKSKCDCSGKEKGMGNYHFLVLGKETRQHYLATMLRELGHEVMVAEDYLPGDHDAILLPVPQTADYLRKIEGKLQKGQIVYGCHFPEDSRKCCEERGIRFVDYMETEGVASRNAVATAEGAIAEALQAGCMSIQDSQVLVVGYGTCGAVLADKLMAWKANVTVVERKEAKREIARTYGCEAISFTELPEKIEKFDIIFNTVPALVVTEKSLERVKKEVVIIDIASRPGGVDFAYCRIENIFAKLCLGLPGKYAPKSAASILMEVIIKTILGD